MFADSDIQHFVLSYVFTFWVPCCDVRYDFVKKNDVRFVVTSSCLYRGLIFYLRLFTYSDIQQMLTIWVTERLSYKRQELLALRGCLGLPPIFGGVSVAHLLVFCVVIFFFFVLCLVYPMLLVSLDCPLLIAPSFILRIIFQWSMHLINHSRRTE
jgi:hypothetical protein